MPNDVRRFAGGLLLLAAAGCGEPPTAAALLCAMAERRDCGRVVVLADGTRQAIVPGVDTGDLPPGALTYDAHGAMFFGEPPSCPACDPMRPFGCGPVVPTDDFCEGGFFRPLAPTTDDPAQGIRIDLRPGMAPHVTVRLHTSYDDREGRVIYRWSGEGQEP